MTDAWHSARTCRDCFMNILGNGFYRARDFGSLRQIFNVTFICCQRALIKKSAPSFCLRSATVRDDVSNQVADDEAGGENRNGH